ncbi:hypothetical protein [Streptomyces sp.]|uniref:hypothetical protein n=1 Tax=Streptomyces sp. TaxID=1931 RepID=UPI00281100CB|nr:hypothetical protein [Streptomyces sp.]
MSEDRSRRDCLAQLRDEWPHAHLLHEGRAAGPRLTALARFSALVCRMPPGVLLDTAEDLLDTAEDLLDIYDTYTVGGPADTPP